MKDNYFHSDNNLLYVTESIPGPKEESEEYDKLLDDYNSQYKECDCQQTCNANHESVCKCLQLSHGNNYSRFTIDGEDTFRLFRKPDAYPIYECSNNCPCFPLCGNRVVQRGPISALEIRTCQMTQKGLGLFTQNFIPKDSFVCEYAGELLTKSQALLRIKDNELKKHMNYIFCLNEHTSSGTTQTFVDPSKFGNIGRYINHSCDPNCCVIPVRFDSLIPKLAIFACKDIQRDEEITFCYGNISSELRYIENDVSQKNCFCNTYRCQGLLPFQEI